MKRKHKNFIVVILTAIFFFLIGYIFGNPENRGESQWTLSKTTSQTQIDTLNTSL